MAHIHNIKLQIQHFILAKKVKKYMSWKGDLPLFL
jgi:hypothetical protein